MRNSHAAGAEHRARAFVTQRAVEGVITAQLPSGLYEVNVDGARITAHVGSGSEKNFMRLLVGDRVMVELTPRDRHRGRIVRKA
jgi:translation initiation factor IF-1